MIIFKDDEHQRLYEEILSKMKRADSYHSAVAYLLSLDTVLREHIGEVFDFAEDGIKPEGLNRAFQTGSSRKTTRLAFNLWNGYYTDGETYTDKAGYVVDLPSSYYSPEQIFCSSYAPYYWQAIKLRYPNYTE